MHRTTWLVFPGLVAALLLAAAGVLTFELGLVASGRAALEAGRAEAARQDFDAATRIAVIDRWVPVFNRGVANYHLERWDAAATDFEDAARSAPAEHQCAIRLSWAASLEAGGDYFRANDDEDAALIRYQQAQIVLAAAQCSDAQSGTTPSDADRQEEARTRLESKVTDGSPTTSRDTDAQAEVDPERELREREQQAQQQRQQAEDRAEGAGGGDGEKTW